MQYVTHFVNVETMTSKVTAIYRVVQPETLSPGNAADLLSRPTNLMHWVGEERLEGAPLARRLLLESVEEVGELGVLLALRQDLSSSDRTYIKEENGVLRVGGGCYRDRLKGGP